MNKLVPSALFSPRDAEEQRIRDLASGRRRAGEPGDARDSTNAWDRGAAGFRRNDLAGTKLAALCRGGRKAAR